MNSNSLAVNCGTMRWRHDEVLGDDASHAFPPLCIFLAVVAEHGRMRMLKDIKELFLEDIHCPLIRIPAGLSKTFSTTGADCWNVAVDDSRTSSLDRKAIGTLHWRVIAVTFV